MDDHHTSYCTSCKWDERCERHPRLICMITKYDQEEGSLEAIRDYLIKHPRKVNEEKDGYTALMISCDKPGKEYYQVAKLLIELGADLDQTDYEDYTALMFLCSNPNRYQYKLMKKVIPHSNINLLNDEGNSALSIACYFAKSDYAVKAVQLLLENGANPNLGSIPPIARLVDDPFDLDKYRSECLELLLGHGANVNWKDRDNRTLLIMAVQRRIESDVRVSRLLIENGIDINARDNSEKTVVAYILKHPMKDELLTLLLEHGLNADRPYHGQGQTLRQYVTEWRRNYNKYYRMINE